MNSRRHSVGCLPGWALAVVVVAFCSSESASGITDPTLTVGLTRANGNAILTWGGANAVPYQVQTSSNLTAWTDLGPIMTGTGSQLSFTNPVSGQNLVFFRIQRVFPAAPGSASFNPATGVLTVVGDNAHTVLTIANDGFGNITVNAGAIPITGGTPTVANTVLIQVLGSTGDDQISLSGSLPIAHLFGGEGDDTIIGGPVGDLIVGGPGNDLIIGKQGNDVIYLGDGNDTVIWNPGDGSDFVEGEGGSDTVEFNGANVNENISLSANGPALVLFRDVANITFTSIGVETVNLHTLGGADNVTVNRLAGTAVAQVNIDLAASLGTTNGDTQIDTVIVNGTAGADTFDVAANGAAVEVSGNGALIHVINGELANDRIAITGVGNDTVNVNGTPAADTLQFLPSPVAGFARAFSSAFTVPVDVIGALTLSINGLAGPDIITGANGLAALNIPIVLDGGDGDDTIFGGDEPDVIYAGNGNDTVSGGRGNDVVLLGDGDDTFLWNPGDGSDTVEGQTGNDTLQFNCANVAEHIDLSANGSRLLLFRDVANITMDVDGVETVNLPVLGGADFVTVNSLAGTAVTQVNVELAASGGTTGDGLADTVTVNGTAAPDTIDITANAGAVEVSGLAALVRITHSEVALDTLIVNGLGGVDSISTGPGVTTLIGVMVNQ